MAKHIVKADFIDKNTRVTYKVGDEYPKLPTDERLAELTGKGFIDVADEIADESDNSEDTGEDSGEDGEKPTDKSTVEEIKAYLDQVGTEYDKAAKKADLLALI